MGLRIIQKIYTCSLCGKTPLDGEKLWRMGCEEWCEECCEAIDKDDEEKRKEKENEQKTLFGDTN